MGLLSKLFGSKKPGAKEMLANGAIVIDVRSKGEFQSGHIKKSKNIPLDQIPSKLAEIKAMDKQIVFCCASGMRSGRASGLAKRQGIECANGGSWMRVKAMMNG
jgi:phage shock protein E